MHSSEAEGIAHRRRRGQGSESNEKCELRTDIAVVNYYDRKDAATYSRRNKIW